MAVLETHRTLNGLASAFRSIQGGTELTAIGSTPISASHRRPRAKLLATLLGVTCLAFVAIPTVAQAFTISYEIDDDGRRIYSVQGNASAETLTLGCSGGEVTANGVKYFSSLEGHNLRCGELDYIGINGNGGNDTISTVAVSEANGFNPGFGCCDEPPTPSHAVELYGGPGQDTLNGGPFGEQFNGRHDINEGADTVHGGGGRDRIAGTRDADKIFGDAGDDLIDAQFGNDVVHGGPGKDLWDDPRLQHRSRQILRRRRR